VRVQSDTLRGKSRHGRTSTNFWTRRTWKILGVDVPTMEYLIRVRNLEYVRYGAQRGRVIPVAGLRRFLRRFLERYRQAAADELLKHRRR
jgi:hypothetical protein